MKIEKKEVNISFSHLSILQLYKVKHEVQFFGRGSIAGVDVNQQKKVRL